MAGLTTPMKVVGALLGAAVVVAVINYLNLKLKSKKSPKAKVSGQQQQVSGLVMQGEWFNATLPCSGI